ncbi:YciI family protein [Demetria terragena]|uniref:YciI family protein n=1 Tax=Demetria terragena TaxID=63959 RepID=UPI000366A4DF|nr:YciI family protein [Demetria terragena]
MAIYSVEYRYTDDSAGRDTHRPEHRAYLDAQEGLLISGPFRDEPAGALILLRAENVEEVERILAGDPFQREGLVASQTIRDFNPVLGPHSEALHG